jgi:hypothetical protein
VAPLLLLPVIAWLLMEYGPERSFVLVLYPLVWSIAFVGCGTVLARRRPSAPRRAVIVPAAGWALAIVATVLGILVATSLLLAH